MKTKNKIFFLIFISILLSNLLVNAQNINLIKHKAQTLFNNEKFTDALPLFLKLDSLEPNNFETKYHIGACYLNTKYEKTKAIPYLKYAIDNGKKLIPATVFKDLGIIYHLNYQFDKSIEYFNRYKKLSYKNDEYLRFTDSMITVCKYAKVMVNDSSKFIIQKLPKQINTKMSEETPFISADNSIIFFTRETNVKNKTKNKIFFSEKKNNKWTEAKELIFERKYRKKDIKIAGLSHDGQQIFLSILNNGNYDIYIGKLDGTKCYNIKRLSNAVNSIYDEFNCSLSANGSKLIFTSNRPGGYGGKDLYSVDIDSLGNITNPLNLGNDINTKYDEDAPFFHPDNKSLYFSSNGHKTIGGFDIYLSELINNNTWTPPKNMGYPINTTYDDYSFVLSASKGTAYISSNKQKKYKDYDIYKIIINKSIPLTLVKGTIMAGDPPKPIKATIRIIDKETNTKLKYIYNSTSKTGKYLMIFPPNKHYSMIISAKGYIPYKVDIFVPDQIYFYELFQEIILSPIKLDNEGNIIGQEIHVTNTFYDIYNTIHSSPQLIDTIYKKDYTDLINLINKLIKTTDTISLEKIDNESKKIIKKDTSKINKNKFDKLISSITDAILNSDTNALEKINKNTKYNNEIIGKYYFNEDSNKINLDLTIINGDTIKTLPTLETFNTKHNIDYNNLIDNDTSLITSKDKQKTHNKIIIRKIPKSQRKYIITKSIYYKSNQYNTDNKYLQIINDITKILINNKNLGVEINSYTDATGDDKSNLILSNKRAISVLKLFIEKGININNIIINFYGETKSTNEKNEIDKQNDRRTDIKIFEVKTK